MPYSNPEDKIKHGKFYYRQNIERIKERERNKYFENKATILKRRKELNTSELRARNSERERLRYIAYRGIVIEAYGSICACCGENEILFLEIDHVNNDGYEHRKKIGNGSKNLIYWLIQSKFPEGYQLLCANCNQGKRRNGGICPHRSKNIP